MYARQNDASRGEVCTSKGVWASGSFKDVYKGRYTEGSRAGKRSVSKFMRNADPYLAEVFNMELEVVDKAQELIDKFNNAGFVNKPIYLNKPQVWCGTDGAPGSGWDGKRMLVEPMISNYEKFNSNTGWVPTGGDTWADVMQALSHYTYHVSGARFCN